jgi:hypothetical protein
MRVSELTTEQSVVVAERSVTGTAARQLKVAYVMQNVGVDLTAEVWT